MPLPEPERIEFDVSLLMYDPPVQMIYVRFVIIPE